MDRTIIFQVKYLGRCGMGYKEDLIRKIEIQNIQTLEEFQFGITKVALGWKDPHTYSFFMDNKPYSRNRELEYSHDSLIEKKDRKAGVKSAHTRLKDLDLKVGQKIHFLFDYGDDHQFEIKVIGFGRSEKLKVYPMVLEEIGIAPEQYPPID